MAVWLRMQLYFPQCSLPCKCKDTSYVVVICITACKGARAGVVLSAVRNTLTLQGLPAQEERTYVIEVRGSLHFLFCPWNKSLFTHPGYVSQSRFQSTKSRKIQGLSILDRRLILLLGLNLQTFKKK